MTTKNINSVKELNTIKREAKNEVNAIVFSPFYIVNTLNACVKGKAYKGIADLIKAGFSVENVKALAKELGGTFNVDAFHKEASVFCELKSSKKCPKHGYNLYAVTPKAWLYWKPIPCTFNGFIDAFTNIAKVDVREREREARKAENDKRKAARKAAKAKADKETCLSAYGAMSENWTIDRIETMAKAARKAGLAA